tara:strand:+ start:284 stop:760 length:477 start_codon:yes stop_codon:yes gene_type:complete
MNIYILSAILIFVLFIPVSFASAADLNFSKSDDGSAIYLFVQIIHRDSDGNLLALVQSDRMTYVDANLVNFYVDSKGMAKTVRGDDPNAPYFEIFGEKYTIVQQIENITASTYFVVEYDLEDNPERQQKVAARFAHEGLLLSPGDTVATVWNFAKLLT